MASNQNLQPGQFYGEVLRKQQSSGLILSELRHETARKLPRHSHELAYFCLLLNGNYWEQFGPRRITYKPLRVMFHPPGTTHIMKSDRVVAASLAWKLSLRGWSAYENAWVPETWTRVFMK